MLVIGENINASNKSVGQAISGKDRTVLENLARAQAEAGADYIDVNAGISQGAWESQEAAMEWLVELVQSVTDKPLAIDSDVPTVIEAALAKYNGQKVIINSVSAEPAKLDSIGSLAAERGAGVVALCMGAAGIPDNVEDRLKACDMIVEHLAALGVGEEQIYFDPLVLPVSVDSMQGVITLKTIQEIKKRHPSAKTVMGLSNISFGLPQRGLINRAFLLMAASAGLDAAILNPLDAKIMAAARVADLLVGKDPACKSYIRAYRKGFLAE
ncbi:MAG: dihydropteroate synthase [Dehalococcoidia bacterium]|nr:dihydropteroate synthase [Dehalococcoidia bacterium]